MKEHGHRKHGDKTEIIETTIIPEGQTYSNVQNLNQQIPPTSGIMTVSVGEPQVLSSQQIVTSSVPISSPVTEGIYQPGTTVRKIIDKTTIEHHNNKKEKLKDKAKDAGEKILGFIPDPFHHKDKEATETTGNVNNLGIHPTSTVTTRVPAQTLIQSGVPITTTFPTTQTVPQSGVITTKTVTEYPSTGETHLECDKRL